MRMARTYRAWCVACSTEWTGTEIDDADVPAGEQRAFFTCRDCGRVGRSSVRLTAYELARYRRAVRRTVSEMVESFLRARARLEERCRSLRQDMREGDEGAREVLEATEERLAGVVAPDVDHLEKRYAEAERAERLAPRVTPAVPCPECGAETQLHRETPHGYDVRCPRCGGKVRTRVR